MKNGKENETVTGEGTCNYCTSFRAIKEFKLSPAPSILFEIYICWNVFVQMALCGKE